MLTAGAEPVRVIPAFYALHAWIWDHNPSVAVPALEPARLLPELKSR